MIKQICGVSFIHAQARPGAHNPFISLSLSALFVAAFPFSFAVEEELCAEGWGLVGTLMGVNVHPKRKAIFATVL